MTEEQKELLTHLLSGKYAMLRMSNEGQSVYCLYEGNQVPVKYYTRAVGDFFAEYFKKDKKNRITINFNLIRKKGGKRSVKKNYKEVKNCRK
jgi:hypothetical protein